MYTEDPFTINSFFRSFVTRPVPSWTIFEPRRPKAQSAETCRPYSPSDGTGVKERVLCTHHHPKSLFQGLPEGRVSTKVSGSSQGFLRGSFRTSGRDPSSFTPPPSRPRTVQRRTPQTSPVGPSGVVPAPKSSLPLFRPYTKVVDKDRPQIEAGHVYRCGV